MRTTISIAEPLLKGAKRQATERGVTLSVVIEDAVRKLLFESKPVPAKPFKLLTVTGTLVHPDLDMDRISALLATDDEERYGLPKRKASSGVTAKKSSRKRG
ncbi:MAG: antitoxin [Acidobacteriota bacterium]